MLEVKISHPVTGVVRRRFTTYTVARWYAECGCDVLILAIC